jgi:SAM-dependent methyltransferase
MSATNRGAVRSEGDFYRTPEISTLAIVRALATRGCPTCGPSGGGLGSILDAGCGDGAITAALIFSGVPAARILGVDVSAELVESYSARTGSKGIVADYLTSDIETDTVFMNPPFSHAYEFIAHARELAACVVALVRCGWLEGAKSKQPERLALLKQHPPDVYFLTSRPSFGPNAAGKKGTDASAYVWLVWDRMSEGRLAWL